MDGPVGWIEPPRGWLGPARAVVSCRTGGVSGFPFGSLNLGYSAGDSASLVAENEKRFAAAVGMPGPAAKARLEHGVASRVVEAPGVYTFYDALLTSTPGLPLWITVADCLPVFLAAGPWLGIAHAGWRGTAGGIAANLAREIGARGGGGPAGVRAWIGPGVGPCCYEVGPDVAAQFPAAAVEAAGTSLRLDLRDAVRRSLVAAGVPADAIAVADACTSCLPERFFSYRRDGARSGRMAAVAWIP